MSVFGKARVASLAALVACAPSTRAEAPAPAADAGATTDAGGENSEPRVGISDQRRGDAGPAASPDAGVGVDAAAPAPLPKVKVVTIGMHVAGGPFDEVTKEPFKKAVEPHFPEVATCWGSHGPKAPPKSADVGVDLLIEAGGGRPKVSNPRSTLEKGSADGFVPCVIAVFESVAFPKLERGRTGVSYSLRFTP